MLNAARLFTQALTFWFDEHYSQTFGNDKIALISRFLPVARVYEVSTGLYSKMGLLALGELEERRKRDHPSLCELSQQDRYREYSKIIRSSHFTAPLPFTSIFIALSKPLTLGAFSHTAGEAVLMGHLLFHNGGVLWVFSYLRDQEKFWIHQAHGLDPDGQTGWVGSFGIELLTMPILLPILMKPSLRQRPPTATERHELKRGAKKARQRVTPMPFYVVDISDLDPPKRRDPVIDRAAPSPLAFRFDVSAHQRLLIERGTEPLDPARKLRLMESGWEYWINELPERWAVQLEARGLPPKQPHEWVLVKLSNVRPHQRGPEDKPYIPAVRRLRSDARVEV